MHTYTYVRTYIQARSSLSLFSWCFIAYVIENVFPPNAHTHIHTYIHTYAELTALLRVQYQLLTSSTVDWDTILSPNVCMCMYACVCVIMSTRHYSDTRRLVYSYTHLTHHCIFRHSSQPIFCFSVKLGS